MLCRISLNSSGKLRLTNSSGTQIGSDSATLNTSQWYRIEMKNDATTNHGSLDARLDGTSFASGSNDIQGSWARLQLGPTGTSNCDVYIDDIALNDDGIFSK